MTSRQDNVAARACEFILAQGICSLPVSPEEIIRRNRWGLATYRRLGVLSDVMGSVEPLVGRSRDGFTIYNGRNFCIAYNSDIKTLSRIYFTLMHEIGHIALGHFDLPGASNIISCDPVLEEDASLFASLILAPSVVVTRCGYNTPALLSRECMLSSQAAQARLVQLAGWSPSPRDAKVAKNFSEYIKLNTVRARPVKIKA
jgi:hypothetical protein